MGDYFSGNVAILLIGVPMLATNVSVLTVFGWWVTATGNVLARLGRLI